MKGLFEDTEENVISCAISDNEIYQPRRAMKLSRWISVLIGVAFLCLFLPWTQNFTATGKVTTLRPEDRPQQVHATIAGRIEKWYIKEGDAVKKGDTLVKMSEIKTEYLDPNLIPRTELSLKSKEMSAESYGEKVKALDVQIGALSQNMPLKLEQARNKVQQAKLKVQTDSLNVIAADTALRVARLQIDRARQLYNEGIKPRTEYEDKLNKFQETSAKFLKAQNDYIISKNERINAEIELNTLVNDFREKIAKAESDKSSALSMAYSTESEIAKMQSDLSNYIIRSGYYYILAPQDGYVVTTMKAGVGETVKETDPLATILPSSRSERAVELYVDPVDMPLLRVGKHVRLQFDGWPAFVFNGWPGTSFGTFGGEIAVIDRNISANGKYRILVKPDVNDKTLTGLVLKNTKEGRPWPEEVRVGTGAYGILLLNNVPLYREIWRRINAFPPEFYQPEDATAAGGKEAKK